MIRQTTLAGAALLLALAQGALAQNSRSRGFGDEYRSRIDTTFAFSKDGAVSLNVPSGEIIVRGWSDARVQVKATSDDANIRFDASGSRLTLETAGYRGHGDDVRFEVTVPYGVHVAARAQSGDVSVRGTRGEVEVGSQSGDIVVEDVGRLDVNSLSGDFQGARIRGDVEIHSVSGEARLSDVNGDIEIESVSGDITIDGAVSRYVRAHTTSGDVEYRGTIDPQGRYDLAAHSGDIGITIPESSSAQLTVSTWSGSIESDFPITLRPGEHGIGSAMAKRFTFEIGSGAARISLESFSGDININSTGARPRR